MLTSEMKPNSRRGDFSLLRLLILRLPLVLAFAALAGFAGNYFARQGVLEYEANASVLFRFGIEYTPTNPAFESWRGDPVRLFNNDAILTELQILSSRRVLETTLERLGRKYSDLPDLQAVTSRLSVRRIEGTNVARIRYRGADPALALDLVSQVVSDYLEVRTELFRQKSLEALSSYADQARKDWIEAFDLLQQLESDLDAAGRFATEQAEAAGTSADLSDDSALQLSILKAAEESARRRLDVAVQLSERYDLAEQLDLALGPSIEVLEEAALVPGPVGLTLTTSVALAAALGAAFGVLAAALLEWRRLTKRPLPEV